MDKLIEVKDLTIKTDDQTIIDHLSFDLKEGEFITFVGPSGSGKSTVLKYLALLIDPQLKIDGQFHLKGKQVDDIHPTDLRKEVSYCFQSPNLFGDTVYDNLSFPFIVRDQAFDQARAEVLLESMQLPKTYLTKPINELSGGEKQRVALIRNLLFPPKVLLLDEVTSALDNDTREKIWQALDKYRDQHQTAIIMVSHHESEQAMADRAIQFQSQLNQEGGQ